MHDVLVIGGGIFGSVVARHLHAQGMSVVIVDDVRPERGSAPAGCVIKPSWVSALDRNQMKDGLDLLDQHYGVSTISFKLVPGGKAVTAYRVEPAAILTKVNADRYMVVQGTVERLDDRGHSVGVTFRHGPAMQFWARWVVVAAGLWTPALCPWTSTWGRWGWAHRGMPVHEPVIALWAPYRQVVAFNMDDGMSWSGDGSALKEETFRRPEYAAKARARCLRYVTKITSTMTGVRPYAALQKGEPCLVAPRGHVIAVTGGAKNGTIAAAWAARKVEELVR